MPIRHSKNIRAVIYPNAIVWSAVLAESEDMGFSPSDIVTRALLAQGYGKPQAKFAAKPEPAEFDNNTRWKGESDHEYTERLAVQRGRGTIDAAKRVLERYKMRGMPDIVWDDE